MQSTNHSMSRMLYFRIIQVGLNNETLKCYNRSCSFDFANPVWAAWAVDPYSKMLRSFSKFSIFVFWSFYWLWTEPSVNHWCLFDFRCFSALLSWRSLKSDAQLQKKLLYLFQWKPFKNHVKCCLFISKALLVRKIFKFLFSRFVDVEKNGLIRKIRLISKYLMSQPG